ncbi:protein pygopus [Anopheles marshallii]|uniref:protein pygopus n=1 Tax=Anopheles marshallii TaxID=1521116 RepID=UPI00237B27EF|nr:protein pygopus [Anopheles marshallii]
MSTKKPEIADSWEDIDEEQLVNAITILKNCTSIDEDKADTTKSSATSGNTARQNSLPQMLEEELRPKMVARPMQILKRPQTSGGSEGKGGAADSKPKTQIKSLDQRRQEYAEARLRILGSAHDDEEAETKKPASTNTNGYRVNNVNNNVGYSGNVSSNASSASGSGGGGGGDGMAGNSANNNSNNLYRFHQPYRQQAPIGTFPPGMQNVPPGRGAQGAPVVYYPTTPNHPHHHPHHPMHSTHPLHHPHHTFPPKPHHQQHIHPQQSHQHQQQPPSSHPYQQHFAQHLNHQQSPGGRDAMWYVGMRNGFGYGEGIGPLLGHAPPGAIPNHTNPYNGGAGTGGGTTFGKPNSHGSSGASNIVTNQHVLRLPAGPDGSQGFNMRR